MSAAAAISWAVYLLGVATSAAFLVGWLVGIRIWRRRPAGERPAVRRARQFILWLSLALTLRYVTGIVNLVHSGNHPADGVPAVVGTVLGVGVQIWLLWLLIAARRDEQGKWS